jgi:nucleoside-diphosphate-sugar epimerase
VARPADGSAFDEDSPIAADPLVQSAADAEAIAREAAAKHGFAVGILRGGSFYGPDSAHTRSIGEGLLKRRLGIIGDVEAVWAMIHSDDFASAFLAVAEKPLSGLWHVVDDELVTVPVLLTAFAAKLGAKPPRRVPVWLARLIAGEATVNFFTRTTRTTNARFRRDFEWSPMFPTYREGLDQIVAAWKAEQFLLQRQHSQRRHSPAP